MTSTTLRRVMLAPDEPSVTNGGSAVVFTIERLCRENNETYLMHGVLKERMKDMAWMVILTDRSWYKCNADVDLTRWPLDFRKQNALLDIHSVFTPSNTDTDFVVLAYKDGSRLQRRVYACENSGECAQWVCALQHQIRYLWQAMTELTVIPSPECYQSHYYVVKVNRHGKSQERLLLLSDHRLYNCTVPHNPTLLKVGSKLNGVDAQSLNPYYRFLSESLGSRMLLKDSDIETGQGDSNATDKKQSAFSLFMVPSQSDEILNNTAQGNTPMLSQDNGSGTISRVLSSAVGNKKALKWGLPITCLSGVVLSVNHWSVSSPAEDNSDRKSTANEPYEKAIDEISAGSDAVLFFDVCRVGKQESQGLKTLELLGNKDVTDLNDSFLFQMSTMTAYRMCRELQRVCMARIVASQQFESLKPGVSVGLNCFFGDQANFWGGTSCDLNDFPSELPASEQTLLYLRHTQSQKQVHSVLQHPVFAQNKASVVCDCDYTAVAGQSGSVIDFALKWRVVLRRRSSHVSFNLWGKPVSHSFVAIRLVYAGKLLKFTKGGKDTHTRWFAVYSNGTIQWSEKPLPLAQLLSSLPTACSCKVTNDCGLFLPCDGVAVAGPRAVFCRSADGTGEEKSNDHTDTYSGGDSKLMDRYEDIKTQLGVRSVRVDLGKFWKKGELKSAEAASTLASTITAQLPLSQAPHLTAPLHSPIGAVGIGEGWLAQVAKQSARKVHSSQLVAILDGYYPMIHKKSHKKSFFKSSDKAQEAKQYQSEEERFFTLQTTEKTIHVLAPSAEEKQVCVSALRSMLSALRSETGVQFR